MKIFLKQYILLVTGILGGYLTVLGQIGTNELDGRLNTISTAVPFLRIAPDARSGAMGDVGLAVSADANSIYWNPAKMAFTENEFGLAVSYTPWLRQLVNDIYL